MSPRTAVVLSGALLSTLCLPELALAAPAEGSEEIEVAVSVDAGEADASVEAASEAPATEAPTPEAPIHDPLESAPELSEAEQAAIEAAVEAELAEELEQIDDYYDQYDESYDDWEDDYEPKRTVLELQSGYFGIGIAPGMTIYDGGFHPNTRFEMEFGGTLEHDFRDLGLSFGVVSHVTPYYGRKKPSFGADVTATAMLGPIYLRTGLGALGGLPRNHQLENTSPAVGGVVGAGFNFGRAPMVRVGVDYDFRVTTRLEPIHTVFLAVRIACCRQD